MSKLLDVNAELESMANVLKGTIQGEAVKFALKIMQERDELRTRAEAAEAERDELRAWTQFKLLGGTPELAWDFYKGLEANKIAWQYRAEAAEKERDELRATLRGSRNVRLHQELEEWKKRADLILKELITAHEHACPSRAYRNAHEQRIHDLIFSLTGQGGAQ